MRRRAFPASRRSSRSFWQKLGTGQRAHLRARPGPHCRNPADVFDIPQKGAIEAGKDADLVLVDTTETSEISGAASTRSATGRRSRATMRCSLNGRWSVGRSSTSAATRWKPTTALLKRTCLRSSGENVRGADSERLE